MKRHILTMCVLLLCTLVKGQNVKIEPSAKLNALLTKDKQSEEELSEIHRIYKFELKDQVNAAKVEKVILEKYPKGNYARLAAFASMSKTGNNDTLIFKGEKFLRDFPAPSGGAAKSQEYIYYSLCRVLGAAYFDTKRYDDFLKLAAPVDFRTQNELYRWNIVRAYMSKKVLPADLYPVASKLMKTMLPNLKDSSFIEDRHLSRAEALAIAQTQLEQRLITHISLLNDLGKYEEALSYFKLFSPKGLYAEADLNEVHWQILLKAHKQESIKEVLEQSVKANAVTPVMFAALKSIYAAEHKNTVGYDKYLASLKSSDEIGDLQKYVKAHLTNQEYMSFALEDISGNMVRSSDWEGKIVVLDFWATWCRPCIMAFPGMQMAVDKYAKDSAVEFYFIDTMQFGDYKEKSTNFIKQEGYRFKMLHDGINRVSGDQNAVFSTFVPFFKSSAIPRKVILKDGIMRYTTEGYSGSPSKLFDEISYAIEILKAESNDH